MDKIGALDRRSVARVLKHGAGLANELKKQLKPDPTSRETCDSLLEKIVSSYEKALNLLDCIALLENGGPLESPNSIEGSPTSDQIRQVGFKKRKTVPKWSEPVRMCTASGTGFEGQHDDGYHWRKYGQKYILGSTHPRAYYRCTHRHTQGCLATKQVQRSDDDPSRLVVVYRGNHSCVHERIDQKKENAIIPKKEAEDCPPKKMITTWPSLKIETQDLNTKEEHFPCFSIPSTPIDDDVHETKFFSDASSSLGETSNCSPHQFLSPSTSDSCNEFPFGHILHCEELGFEELGFAEVISIPTSATNIQFDDLHYLDKVSFDSHLLEDFQ